MPQRTPTWKLPAALPFPPASPNSQTTCSNSPRQFKISSSTTHRPMLQSTRLTTSADSLKLLGYTSTTELTTSHTPPATLICFATPLDLRQQAHSRIEARSWIPFKDGRRIIRLWNLRGGGGCSTTTPRFLARTICDVSRLGSCFIQAMEILLP